LNVQIDHGAEHAARIVVQGPLTCDRGVVRVRMAGAAPAPDVRVLGVVLEGLYQPQLVPFDVVAAWVADIVNPEGQRSAMTGYLSGTVAEDDASNGR
jgi:hypothetical protein